MTEDETTKEHGLSIPDNRNKWLIFNVNQMGELLYN